MKDVSYMDDISDYITYKKRQTLKKTMQTFLQETQVHYSRIRCDIVFVKNWQIDTVVEDCMDF